MSQRLEAHASIRWFGDIPNGWAIERIKHVTISIASGVSVNASDAGADIHQYGVLKTNAVSDGNFFPKENKAVWESEVDRVRCHVTGDSVIMSRMNTPSLVGQSGYVPKDFPRLFLPDRLWKLNFDKNKVFTPFIASVLSSTGSRQAFSCMATGISPSMKNLSIEEMENLPIPLPPIDEQLIISAYLKTEINQIDLLIAEKQHLLALLAEKRAALINHAVTLGLGHNVPMKSSSLEWLNKIPEHWNVFKLKRTWESFDYGLSRNNSNEGAIAVIRAGCIIDGRINVAKAGTIDEIDDNFLLRRGDLLFNQNNSLDQIAKLGIVDFTPVKPMTFAPHLVRIRLNHCASPSYLAELLNASLFLEFARKNATPSIGRANLSPIRYGEIHIPLPPRGEQEEIVEFLKADAAIFIPLCEQIKESINLLKERREALITAAVTGQIPLTEMIL